MLDLSKEVLDIQATTECQFTLKCICHMIITYSQCLNLPEWLLFYFPIVILCLFEYVIIYFNVYTKLEVIVWRNKKLFSWRDKIWFFSVKARSIWFVFCFRLNIFTRFQITLTDFLCTKLVFKNKILPLQKALWTSLKLSRNVENCNTNYCQAHSGKQVERFLIHQD